MASQTPIAPAPRPTKRDGGEAPKNNRNTFVYIGTIIILIITIVAFVFVPSTGGGSSRNGNLEFGSYHGKPIVYSQGSYFAKQVATVNDAMKQQGLSEQNYQLFAYQVYNQAFQRTVVHYGIMDDLAKARVKVSETYLDGKMAENQAFQENGKFSQRLYRETPNATRVAMRASAKDDALLGNFTTDIFSVAPSSKEVDFLKAMAKATRKLEFVAYPLASYPDSEVAAWAVANAKLLQQLKLSKISVTTTEADAKKLLKQLQAGTATFADFAKSHSTDGYADKGGSLGVKYYFDVQNDLDKKEDVEKLAALKAGEISPVLKTTSGSWAFYRADEAIAPAKVTDPQVLKDARVYLSTYEKGKLEDWAIAQAKGLAAQPGAQFEAAAKKANLAVKTTEAFPINFGDLSFSVYGQTMPLFKTLETKDLPELQGASSSENFLKAAFSLAPGAVSEPLVLGENVLVLKVKEAASASDEEVGSIGLFYPYFFQQGLSGEISDLYMKSPYLKNNFMAVFFKNFAPKTQG